MTIESTLLIVKPDGVRRGLVGEILRRVEAKGLTIESMRLFTIDRALAEAGVGRSDVYVTPEIWVSIGNHVEL